MYSFRRVSCPFHKEAVDNSHKVVVSYTYMQFATINAHDLIEAPNVHFADLSARWLFEDPENVRCLVEILNSELAAKLDFAKLTPLQRGFISDKLREQEADLVFNIPFRDDTENRELILHILIEHQSTVDSEMWLRFLSYMCNLWMAQRRQWNTANLAKSDRRYPPIVPILFYIGETRWESAVSPQTLMEIPEVLAEFVPNFNVLVLDVKQADPGALTETGTPLGWLLAVLQKERASQAELRAALNRTILHLETLGTSETTQHDRAMIYLASLLFHRRAPEEHAELIYIVNRQTRNPEVKKMLESMAEVTFNKGMEQGAAIGATDGKRSMVLQLIQHCFDHVPDALIERIKAINSQEQLDALAKHIVSAETLDDIQRLL